MDFSKINLALSAALNDLVAARERFQLLVDTEIIPEDSKVSFESINTISDILSEMTSRTNETIFICTNCPGFDGDVVVDLPSGEDIRIIWDGTSYVAYCSQGCPYCENKRLVILK